MSFGDAVYNLLVFPIEIVYQVFFRVSEGIFNNPAISIFVLSVLVNLVTLPIYKRADLLSQKQYLREQGLKPVKDRIQKTFKGDERMMMLNAYYREQGYNPASMLLGSLPVILQVPFFIAAYHFLSNLHYLEGHGFLFIKDLAEQDGLLGGVNLLPILMTVINLLSLWLYTRKHPGSRPLQSVFLAFIFLVLLYNSPAGLVYYWTLNNLFSLIKNLIPNLRKQSAPKVRADAFRKKEKEYRAVFVLSSLFLTLEIGYRFQISILAYAYQDFIDLVYYRDPFIYAINSLLIAAGFFVVWMSVYYFLAGSRVRRGMALILFGMATTSIYNSYTSSTYFNEMTPILVNKQYVYNDPLMLLTHSLSTLLIFVLSLLILMRFKKLSGYIALTLLVTVSVLSVSDTYKLVSENSDKYYLKEGSYGVPAEIPISRNGRNVVVIMLDRSVGTMIPYVMGEDEEIKDKFDGFTFYKNTNSFGCLTIIGSPSIYGGYEYTPASMNKRDDMLISEKLNEALKVMPAVFRSEGFDVTLCDPTYAGFNVIPNLDIFDDIEGVNTYVTTGAFCDESEEYTANYEEMSARQMRNFFFYGLLRNSPDILRDSVYDGGNYNSLEYTEGGRRACAGLNDYLRALLPLKNLSRMTKITDEGDNYDLFVNYTAHATVLLGYNSEGDVIRDIDGNEMEIENTSMLIHYEVNRISYEKIGDWLDYLREEGVYDNTRIIIVSDHGADMGREVFENGVDIDHLHPVLLFKDFNSTGEFKISDEPMCNADTPTLVFKDIIDDPVNPYTGNHLDRSYYDTDTKTVLGYGSSWNPWNYKGTRYDDGAWFNVTGDFFDEKNWEITDIP